MALTLWQGTSAWADLNIPAGSQTLVSGSEESLACTDLITSGTGQLNLNAGSEVQIRQVRNGGTINGAPSGLLEVNDSWTNTGSFIAGGSTVKLTNRCGTSNIALIGSTTFNNLDVSGQGSSAITVTLPELKQTTGVNGQLTFGNGNRSAVTVAGPYCAGILLGPQAPAPNLSNVTLGPGIWIARQPPAQCAGGNPSQSAVPVPGLGAQGVGLLSLLLGGALAWGRRRARGGRRQA